MAYCDREIQQALRSWVAGVDWRRPFAVTLTMKQGIPVLGGGLVRLTPDIASQNLRHFLNLLNREVHGKAYVRHGRRLKSFVALEGSADKRLHFHLILECPREELVPQFPWLITELWMRTDWGYRQVDVQPADAGWMNYMTKRRDKADYAAAYDWQLSHFD